MPTFYLLFLAFYVILGLLFSAEALRWEEPLWVRVVAYGVLALTWGVWGPMVSLLIFGGLVYGTVVDVFDAWWRWPSPRHIRRREVLLYNGDGPGSEMVGRPVNMDGRTGVVVEGTVLTITVEWDDEHTLFGEDGRLGGGPASR